ncbi:MAG: DUF2817 domain-containing protein [Pseudomonadota bacterium]
MQGDFISYPRGRARFANAVATAGGRLDSIANPNATTAEGHPITMDIAWIGPVEPTGLLLSTSGVHGLEAPAGSAALCHFLQNLPPLPSGIAIALIHGVNGWGWAHNSRANEHNVDLNRNMADFSHAPEKNTLYKDALHDIFCPAAISDDPTAQMRTALESIAARHGPDAVKIALDQGQYERPDGVYYGGARTEWSNAILLSEINKRIAGVRHVAYIDWHTGIGEFGETFFICHNTDDIEAHRRAATWWEGGHIPSWDDKPPSRRGLIIKAVEAATKAAGARFTGATVEFGVRPPDAVEAAIMVDRALRFGVVAPETPHYKKAKEFMIDAFCPDSDVWRRQILERALPVFDAALTGLKDETDR